MENQNIASLQNDGKSYFKRVLVFTVLILVLVALIVLSDFDFVGKGSNPSGTATLSWEANTEPDLAGYKIYYGASPRAGDCPDGGYLEKIEVGKTTTPEKPSFTVKGLEAGKTYYFSVTSRDTSGNESCFSAEMSKAFPASD